MDNEGAPELRDVEAINDEKILFQQVNDAPLSYCKLLKGTKANSVHQVQSSSIYAFVIFCTNNGFDVVLPEKYEDISEQYVPSFSVKVKQSLATRLNAQTYISLSLQ